MGTVAVRRARSAMTETTELATDATHCVGWKNDAEIAESTPESSATTEIASAVTDAVATVGARD